MPDPDGAVALPPALAGIRSEIERTLIEFLEDERASIEAGHPSFLPLFDEVRRMVRAGGKRLRPMFCWLGYRAGRGADEAAVARVAAAIELFHTFALIHDDVMDQSETRRGAPTIHVRMAGERGASFDSAQFGVSSAILAGDFAMVLADELFLTANFPADRLAAAFRRYNHMRVEVAVGQFLDLERSGRAVDEAEARTISSLKSGSYSVEGPLQVGAILAGASAEVLSSLARYGAPLGEAFQVRDDVEGATGGDLDLAQARPTVVLAKAFELSDGRDRAYLEERLGRGLLPEADRRRVLEILRSSGALDASAALADSLIDRAVDALEPTVLERDAMAALRGIADTLRIGSA